MKSVVCYFPKFQCVQTVDVIVFKVIDKLTFFIYRMKNVEIKNDYKVIFMNPNKGNNKKYFRLIFGNFKMYIHFLFKNIFSKKLKEFSLNKNYEEFK